MYQCVIQQTLQGFPGARNISDGIFVFGSDQASHDKSLELTLERHESKGLTLNREKCVFSLSELVFFGFKISADGTASDDKCGEECENTTNAAKPRSFLGIGRSELASGSIFTCTENRSPCTQTTSS